MSSITKDLTRGPIFKEIILFALPLLAGSFIQLLYNTVDLIFVGQFLGKESSSAVGASSLLVNCMLGFFTGMGVGVGILTAKAFAAQKKGELKRIIHCTAGMTIAFSLTLIAVGVCFTPVFLKWLRTPDSIIEEATVYLRIYFLSLLAIVSYNLGSGIIRALGNSRVPMNCQLIGGIANVIGDAVFLGVLKMGVEGVALATLLSQSFAAALIIRRLHRLDSEYRLRVRDIRIYPELSKKILKIGIPAAVQAIMITVSNLIVQANINGLGVNSIAAFTAYFKIEDLIYLPIMAFGQAMSAFTSQNIGIGNTERIQRGTSITIRTGVLVTITISFFVLLFSRNIFGVFLTDLPAIHIGCSIALVSFPFYFLYVFLEVFSSVIRGSGKTLQSMLIVIINMCVVRLCVLNIVMNINAEAGSVAVLYPVTWASTALCMFVYYKRGRWKIS